MHPSDPVCKHQHQQYCFVRLTNVDIPFLCNSQNEQRSAALLWDRRRVCAYECVCVLFWKVQTMLLLFYCFFLDSGPKVHYIYGAAHNIGKTVPSANFVPLVKTVVKWVIFCHICGDLTDSCRKSSRLIQNTPSSPKILLIALMLENWTLLFNILLM